MDIDADNGFNSSGDSLQQARQAGAQLSLALGTDSQREDALRAAWMRSRLPLPYDVALRSRPLAICLSCLAEAMQRSAGTDRRSSRGRHISRRKNR